MVSVFPRSFFPQKSVKSDGVKGFSVVNRAVMGNVKRLDPHRPASIMASITILVMRALRSSSGPWAESRSLEGRKEVVGQDR